MLACSKKRRRGRCIAKGRDKTEIDTKTETGAETETEPGAEINRDRDT